MENSAIWAVPKIGHVLDWNGMQTRNLEGDPFLGGTQVRFSHRSHCFASPQGRISIHTSSLPISCCLWPNKHGTHQKLLGNILRLHVSGMVLRTISVMRNMLAVMLLLISMSKQHAPFAKVLLNEEIKEANPDSAWEIECLNNSWAGC